MITWLEPTSGTSQPLILIPNLHSQKKWHHSLRDRESHIFLLDSAPGPDLVEGLGKLQFTHVVLPTGANTTSDERWPEGLATGQNAYRRP